jgi:hypothetical protein
MRLANRSSRRAITLANPGEVGEGGVDRAPLSRLGLSSLTISPAGRAKLEHSQILMHAHSRSMASRLTAKWGEIESAAIRAIHTGGRRCAHGATASKKAATPCILAS